MAYIGLTIEKNMYFGAKKELILLARELRKNMTPAEVVLWKYQMPHPNPPPRGRERHCAPIIVFPQFELILFPRKSSQPSWGRGWKGALNQLYDAKFK